MRSSSNAGWYAPQLCEICMKSSTSLDFKGHSAADKSTNPQQNWLSCS